MNRSISVRPSAGLLHKSPKFRLPTWLRFTLGLSLLPIVLSAGSAWGATRITIAYGLLERSIPIESLDSFAKTGKIDSALRSYTHYLKPDQVQQLRELLQSRAKLSPVAVAQFLYTDPGEILLQRLGQVIRTEANLSGFYAIRGSLILAAADPQGLTVLNVLEKFPFQSVRVDLSRALQILGDLEQLIRQTQDAIALIQQQSDQEASAQPGFDFSQMPDLRRPGALTSQKITILLRDPARRRSFFTDIYLPQFAASTPVRPAPVVVISHGLGGDRTSFAYLATQLASYGFVVAVPEHPGSNADQLLALASGRASQVTSPSEFINRPLDIKYLLDNLEARTRSDPRFEGRLNLQQVGVVGQSFGGYTALALAGGAINFNQLRTDCVPNDSLNLSLLLQCRALELPRPIPNLKDDRVKAIIAINPIGSSLLGKADFSNIKIPVMLISSSSDTVAPALPEQILPFTWIQSPNKYFVLLQGGTHFSTIDTPPGSKRVVELPPTIVGPNPRLARTYVKSMSVAFFGAYLADQPQFLPYLDAAYAQRISQDVLPISLVQALSSTQLDQAIDTNLAEQPDQPNQPAAHARVSQ